jgi:hypothetical protein
MNPGWKGYVSIAAVAIASLVTASGARSEATDSGWRDPCRSADSVRGSAIERFYERRDHALV